jgi:hypothetical protein
LVVNEWLAKERRLPDEVRLAVSPSRLGARTVVLKSKHAFRARLLDSDLRMIDDAGDMLANAAPVSLTDYLRQGTPADTGGP